MSSAGAILLLVSPHSGIIETWLPVLCRLRARCPETRIHAILPRPEQTPLIEAGDFAVRHSAGVWNSWLQALPTGGWVEHASPRWIGPSRLVSRAARRVRRLAGARPTPDRTERARLLAQSFGSKFGRHFADGGTTVLCDIADLRHPELRELIMTLSAASIFCQAHGIDRRTSASLPSDVPERRESVAACAAGRKLTALLLADSERGYYRECYGLENAQMRVRGVLRHDPDWLRSLADGPFAAPPLDEPYVFVASRPISQNFLPRESKYAILRMVRDHARRRGMAVMIRKHPVERQRGRIEVEHCLGAAGRRNGWFETRCHPLHLGLHAELNVTLYSSVAVDLARMDRPVVEPIDFADCPPETPNIRTGDDGRRVSFYQQSGLAVPARDRDGFDAVVDAIRDDGRSPASIYERYYADPRGAVEDVVARILDRAPPRGVGVG